MKEYVEKAAVISIIKTAGFWEKEDSEVAITCVDQTPAADVVEVRHGKWNNDGQPVFNWICRCSLCGCPQDYKHNYCPNCGARMDKEADHD